MLRFILLLSVAALAVADKLSFKNHKVFRVTPVSEEQKELVRQFEDQPGYSLWRGFSAVSSSVDLMVSPEQQAEFAELMNATSAKYELYVPDVQQLIDSENPMTRESGFGWNRYHSLDEIYNWMDSLARQYPGKVQVVTGGRSYEGRPIKGVKLSFGQNKPGVFIEGGIHAREWISPATVTYLLNEFLTSSNPEIRRLAEAHDWYMFPSVNPDGYVFTHRSNRMWRKTRSKTSAFCQGADANRNWGFQWMSGGASNNPCAETYAGKSAFSEVETRSLSQYIKSIGQNLFAYIAFHSYSQLLLLPYGHTKQHLDNYDELLSMGQKAIAALQKRHGTSYVTGNIAETIYVASGGSMDWAKATLKIPVAFTYEFRDKGRYGFVLPADQIIPNGEEVMDSFLAMFKEAARFGYPKTPASAGA